MTNADLFLESMVHTQHKVFGMKLKPLTLFHTSILEKYNNPIFTGGTVTKSALEFAVIVCSSNNISEIQGKLKSKVLHLWFMLFDHSKSLTDFQAYIDDYLALPDTYAGSKEDDTSVSNIAHPYALLMMANIMKHTNYQMHDLFYKLPIGALYWLNSSIAYLESGDTDIITDKDKVAINLLSHQLNPQISKPQQPS